MYDDTKGVLINDQAVRVQGSNNHHEHGSIGTAFNVRAPESQLRVLQEMWFMVINEIFGCWNSQKTTDDYHLLFTNWREPDLRAFVRGDRNHPSVIAWSFGNEVVEQYGSSAETQILDERMELEQLGQLKSLWDAYSDATKAVAETIRECKETEAQLVIIKGSLKASWQIIKQSDSREAILFCLAAPIEEVTEILTEISQELP
ncbi:Uu.00g062760.m01.CDS01 [Anthostomella pinea]|uniref:Uu.00g062760.m01.CDS01 n=1 Tax=Anthostomella pinea TaxID=933095 RepID=A0AAI8VT86_9PEZI|nr:Uu.00g062760.m01.CDS01 [Anthostomella pinea]